MVKEPILHVGCREFKSLHHHQIERVIRPKVKDFRLISGEHWSITSITHQILSRYDGTGIHDSFKNYWGFDPRVGSNPTTGILTNGLVMERIQHALRKHGPKGRGSASLPPTHILLRVQSLDSEALVS